jgi:hypothetical protein
MWATMPQVACAVSDCSIPYSVYGAGPPLAWGGTVLIVLGLAYLKKPNPWLLLGAHAVGIWLILSYMPRWINLLLAASIAGLSAFLADPGEPMLYLVSGVLAFLVGMQGYVKGPRLHGLIFGMHVPYALAVFYYAQVWLG